jgi:hypothetical protein
MKETSMPNRSYSFKEGLTMMAAKDVGIDPHLAAEAGEDARSILAALRRAKTAKGPEKSKHIAAAQTELRKLSPKQHAKLINALQAKVLALQGRGGDTAVAHLESGEMVVPRRVLTPELMQLIASEAAKRGINPKQLIVGSRKASINPATGAEEFGVGFGGWVKGKIGSLLGDDGKLNVSEYVPVQPETVRIPNLYDGGVKIQAANASDFVTPKLHGQDNRSGYEPVTKDRMSKMMGLEELIDGENEAAVAPYIDRAIAAHKLPFGSREQAVAVDILKRDINKDLYNQAPHVAKTMAAGLTTFRTRPDDYLPMHNEEALRQKVLSHIPLNPSVWDDAAETVTGLLPKIGNVMTAGGLISGQVERDGVGNFREWLKVHQPTYWPKADALGLIDRKSKLTRWIEGD